MAISYESQEVYHWSRERKSLTFNEHGIPGIQTFGHLNQRKADIPLLSHVHHNCIEIIYLVKGQQTFILQNKEYHLFGNNVFISFPEEIHGSGTNPQEIIEYYWIQIDIRAYTQFLGLNSAMAAYYINCLKNISKRVFKCNEDLKLIVQKAFDYSASPNPEERRFGISYLQFFIFKIIESEESFRMLETNPAGISIPFTNVIGYIQNNIEENIDLGELADYTGLSLSRFKQRFRHEIGTSPREYINHLKIEKAKELLKNPSISITDIAFKYGFSSSNYFAMVFRHVTGITPSSYRESIRDARQS